MITTSLIIQLGQLFLYLNTYLLNALIMIHLITHQVTQITQVHLMIPHHLGHLTTGVAADSTAVAHQMVGKIKKSIFKFLKILFIFINYL